MVMLSKSANLSFFIAGQQLQPPVEWLDISVLATFDNDAVQANITTDRFTFVRESAEFILSYIADGLTVGAGIFSGIPFQICANNITNQEVVFDGFLDLSENFEYLEAEQKVICSIKKRDGLNSLDIRAESLTYGFLEDAGDIASADYTDVEYTVVKPVNAFEILSLSVVLYQMLSELFERIEKLGEDIVIPPSIAAGGGITGPIGATVYKVFITILRIIAAVAVLLIVLDLANNVLAFFFPPKRTHKAIALQRLLEIAAEKLGYTFLTSIEDFEKFVYLPSNISVDSVDKKGFVNIPGTIKKGIPNVSDYGYRVSETFELASRLFYGKFAVIGKTLHFHPRGSDFWIKQSTYILPDVLRERKQYNTDELFANILLAFDTDIVDEWTIDNFTGTNYEVITTAPTVPDTEANFISGLDETRFNVCLGNRKDRLNPLDNVLALVASVFDSITKVFGGSSNYAGKFKNKTNLLKVSNNNHSKPKLLYIENGRIPANHRDFVSAQALWDGYHIEKSFVSNEFHGQKLVFTGQRIPFGFGDYLQLINNSYFTDVNGKTGKVTRLEWTISQDFATVDYWIREPYTANLEQTFIEA